MRNRAGTSITIITVFLLMVVYTPLHASLQNGNEAYLAGDFVQARMLWSQISKTEPRALHNLAMLYSQGIGVPREPKRANRLFYQAAIRGYAPAQYQYSKALLSDQTAVEDSGEIVFWLKNAARQSYSHAYYELGKLFSEAILVEKDLEYAIRVLHKAVDSGVSGADELLSRIEVNLPGVTQDTDDEQISARLVEGRGTLAQRRLFYQGQKAFIRQEYDITVQYWAPLAEQGMAKAQYGIAFMLESGWGVVQDFNEAAHWYKLSAQKGHRKAQFNLGRMYVEGRGVELNKGIGFFWIQSAADLGEQRAVEYMSKLQ